MNKEIEALAFRAIACPRWRWLPGMLALSYPRSIWIRIVNPPTDDTSECFPDLSDPATLGALLALVREGFGPTFHLIPLGGWLAQGARLPNGATVNLGICEPSEAAALVAALEAASLSPAP